MKNTQPATAVRGTFGEFPSAKKLPGMALRVAITAILLWLAFRPANWSMIWVGLLRMHGAWFAAAIAALTLQVGIAAQRWRWIATGCGVAISLASALRYVFVGQFFNQALYIFFIFTRTTMYCLDQREFFFQCRNNVNELVKIFLKRK